MKYNPRLLILQVTAEVFYEETTNGIKKESSGKDPHTLHALIQNKYNIAVPLSFQKDLREETEDF
jgi:hypothetical protein